MLGKQQIDDLHAGRLIQIAGGFIGQQDRRIVDQGPRNGHALLLAPGKLRRVVIGGAACPRSMLKAFQENYGVEVRHAWGMTEMSPLGTICTLKPEYAALEGDARLDIQTKQGHAPFTVEMKLTDDAGTPLARDVIKSGGEWISSIELENLAVGHPAVAEAAVIGVRHPKWDERPLLVVVMKPGQQASKAEILDFMRGKTARWWMPDDVVFVPEIPHSGTGKILKAALREQFRDYVLPRSRD